MELEASLITNTSDCYPLVSFLKEDENKLYANREIYLEDAEINNAVNLYAKLLKCESYDDDNFPFTISKCEGPSITLRRWFSSYCHCCDKDHDSIDVYLTIRSVNRTVVLHCYRKPGSEFIIGNLKTELVLKNEPYTKNETYTKDKYEDVFRELEYQNLNEDNIKEDNILTFGKK